MCFKNVGRPMLNGSASSPTDASPKHKRATTARRVGSERAANARSSCGWFSMWQSMIWASVSRQDISPIGEVWGANSGRRLPSHSIGDQLVARNDVASGDRLENGAPERMKPRALILLSFTIRSDRGISIGRFAANGMRPGMSGHGRFQSVRFWGKQLGSGRS